ncbi:MAG: hypothetical protein GX376_08060 [Firmicutes bacterium]|nr:hypothetical protein [Bacillota bacterium]
MDKVTFQDIKVKMDQALALIKEALDLSIPLLKTRQRKTIVALWEAFIREFILYHKYRSRATGVNLINSISLRRILFR